MEEMNFKRILFTYLLVTSPSMDSLQRRQQGIF